jgi:lipopolysaccharide export LptBFGC system permease protein LptF
VRIVTHLDRYVFGEAFGLFIVGFSGFLGFLLVNKLFLEADRILNPHMPGLAIVRLDLLEAPHFATWALPVGVLFATLMSMGRLAKDNELTAMFTNGISLYRLVWPFLLLSAIAVTVSYYSQEKLVTLAAGEQQRILDKNPIINEQEAGELNPFIAKLDNGDFVSATSFDKVTGVLVNAVYDDWGNDALKAAHAGAAGQDTDAQKAAEALDAAAGGAVFVAATRGQAVGNTLQLGGRNDTPAYSYSAADPEGLYNQHTMEATKTINLGLDLKKQFTQMKTPQELSQTELAEQSKIKQKRGENPAVDLTDYHFRFSGPFASLAFAMVAMPLSLRAPRDERLLGLILSFVLVLVYYTVYFLSLQLGHNGFLPPWLAAWMMNIVFAFISLGIFIFSRK